MTITYIAARLSATIRRNWKALLCLLIAAGFYGLTETPPTMQVMFFGVLVATWQSLSSTGERHEKTHTHH
ncbi:hypothetical protein [Vibrio sp. Sgm 5]|uniref:hypothetical protein n=1 Tax=Vibrio sp. Sgm 5 TaxID=2994387 RepID=UPI002248D3E6|nr:hypothetical protein [Vibrio sp. Sgm 5]EIA0803391.1 hypothetical protein [Vibrio vulnificus]EMD1175042.1 hypothetical protein [Vibrio harveyi]